MTTPDELCDQAMDLLADGEPEDAAARCREALEADPKHLDALHTLAMALADLGDLDGAIATAKKITGIYPDDPLGFTSLSMFHQRNGQIEEAEAASAQARMLDWKRQIKE